MEKYNHYKTMSSPFCASVLLITKGPQRPAIKIAQILHLSNFFELKRTLLYIHLQSIANQKNVRYSVSMSYFTNIAVQNVNKGLVNE
jgi:hypothetical protein